MKLKKYTDDNNIDLTVLILPYEFQTQKNNCHGKNLIPQSIIEKRSVHYIKPNFLEFLLQFSTNHHPIDHLKQKEISKNYLFLKSSN